MFKPECADSLELLSEYHAGRLDPEQRAWVETHLADCLPCAGVLHDIDAIVVTATAVRGAGDDGVAFPDEDALWQRMSISKPVH